MPQCSICPNEAIPHSKYCARCRPVMENFAEEAARAEALRNGLDRKRNVILCYYTGTVLDTANPRSPNYLTCDHRIPGKKGDLVPACAWVNRMKSQMSEDEFHIAIPLLAQVFDGSPLDTGKLSFAYWNRKVPLTCVRSMLSRATGPVHCAVCDKRCDPYVYCPRCRRLIFSHPADHRLLAKTLREAYDKKTDTFRCHYTGIILNVTDNKSPFFAVYDHRIPRKKGDLVLCASFINAMSSSICSRGQSSG